MEGGFDFLEVFVDVAVVEFEGGDDGDVGLVVEEFCAFVEEGGVVFVAFDDEGCVFFAEVGGAGEVLGLAADEVAGVEACGVEDVCGECGGGGFSVCSADDDGLALLEDVLFEPFGEAEVGDASFKGGFDFWVASAEYVSDDDGVWVPVEVFGGVALCYGDAEVCDDVGGGGVEGVVAASDVESGVDGELCAGDHGGAADA